MEGIHIKDILLIMKVKVFFIVLVGLFSSLVKKFPILSCLRKSVPGKTLNLPSRKPSCEKCNHTIAAPKITTSKSSMTSPRKGVTGFWKSPRGDIGIIFGKNDLPQILKKKVRLQNIITKSIEKEAEIIKQRYIVKHPVIHLLEKNINKIYANEVFLSNKSFAKLKEFSGMAMNIKNQTAIKP